MHPITIACWSYDRIKPLESGQVRIEGCNATFLDLEPEELFHRALHFEEFDVTELSFSNYLTLTARGQCPYVAIPVFPGRRFRHSGIYINTRSGIRKPEDLKGTARRIAGVSGHGIGMDPRHSGGRVSCETLGHPLARGRTVRAQPDGKGDLLSSLGSRTRTHRAREDAFRDASKG